MTTDASSGAHRAAGYFEMPFTTPGQRLTNPAVGLASMVARTGPDGAYTIDVTVLDAPDHRLVRSGVLLAHRVIDGRGEWYLAAPGWSPYLPTEQIEPMGHADLPDTMVDLVRPFRRRSGLGPVAALSCQRSEFRLRDADQADLALVRDDRVTIRRGGVAIARFREVSWQTVGAGPTTAGRAWLEQALVAGGATPVERFPDLVHRLGAPATGRTDFPAPVAPSATAPFEKYVSNLLASRLRHWVTADLALRTGHSDGSDLLEVVGELRDEVRGLSSVFDPGWMADLDAELDWIGEAVVGGGGAEQPAGIIDDLIRSERYLAVLDRLVIAARAPKLGDASHVAAGEVIASLVDTALTRFVKAGRRLSVDSSQERWDQAVLAGRQVQNACAAGSALRRSGHRRLAKRVGRLVDPLTDGSDHELTDLRSRVVDADPAGAFELGRAYERSRAEVRAAREGFVDRWRRRADRLTRFSSDPKQGRVSEPGGEPEQDRNLEPDSGELTTRGEGR
ncbi:MAG: hypothetical protein ACTH2Q_06200 [Propionibacteriaceae bacterium]